MSNRWLLPDGVEEILPNRAFQLERLRRRLLDLYHRWGYDLVIPPLVEFSESLLSGTGADLDLLTFKVTDQLSGRMMGIRADITPQITRMDAHSLRHQGPSRFSYAATVLHTRPRNPLQSRSPIQVGVELYGEPSLAADLEVIELMLETMRIAEPGAIHLDLGHVGIYSSLLQEADLSSTQETELFDLLQRKAVPELEAWLDHNMADADIAAMFRQLVDLSGDASVLEQARGLFADAPAEVELALDELNAIVSQLASVALGTEIYIDLCELRGYHYHTGLIFSVYSPDLGQAIGNGGRYDHVGEAFGRSRPATGFNVSLNALLALSANGRDAVSGIFAPNMDDESAREAVRRLREKGERVVSGFAGQQPDFTELQCDRQLVLKDGEYQVVSI